MNFCSAKLCGFGVPLLECWHMLGWEPKRHTYEVYAFHWCHWFTWKLLPVGCALEMCNTSCFGFSSTHVRRNLENVSWQESPVPDIYGFVTNSVEICCIQRELWYIFRCYKKWSLCFTIHLKPPMHWSKSHWTHNWRAPWKNRTSQYISFSAHHSMVFYFRCSVYWWKGSVRFLF